MMMMMMMRRRLRFTPSLVVVLLLLLLSLSSCCYSRVCDGASSATSGGSTPAAAASKQQQQQQQPQPQRLVGEVSAVYELIDRVLLGSSSGSDSSSSKQKHPFRLELVDDKSDDGLFFQLQDDDSAANKILVSGTTANELSAGIGWYLRYYCNMTYGWPRGGGSHIIDVPSTEGWPKIGKVVTKKRQVPYSYLMNVCTHSYSLVWYSAQQWEQFIDWLALSGVNLVLAMTGQEEIQYQVFSELGLGDDEIRSWFNGPALLTWSRGQNEYGSNICGPLPRSWMKQQYNLQRYHILPRLRQLGIIGQLPGFQGNVPIQLKALYKDANMTRQGATGWMDALDPLYAKVADLWMKTLIDAFGTDHWYQLDGYFNGATAPWMNMNQNMNTKEERRVQGVDGDGTSGMDDIFHEDDVPATPPQHDDSWYARGLAAYQGLSRTDPHAIWSFQGFSFVSWSTQKQAKALKGFIDAVPSRDRFVIIDMAFSGWGEWSKWNNSSYWGTPFVWTTLHDFGGTDGIKGDFTRINEITSYLKSHNTSAIGIGGTPEGIDQNPAYYDFLFESNWRDQPVEDLGHYMSTRKQRQYGLLVDDNNDDNDNNNDDDDDTGAEHVDAAWKLLMKSLYATERNVQDGTGVAHLNPGGGRRTSGSLFESDKYTPTPLMCQVYKAWDHMILASASILPTNTAHHEDDDDIPIINTTNNEPFRYDLINLGREVLAQLTVPMAQNFTKATKRNPLDPQELQSTGNMYIELLHDIDTLVSTDYAFLLGPWIESARQWGSITGEGQANDCYSEILNGTTNCANFYEWNARTQITTWNPTKIDSPKVPGGPIDYAAKHWGGLIKDYYAVRAQILLQQALKDQASNQNLNQTAVDRLFAQHAYQWTTSTTPSYSTKPIGDAVVVSNDMFFKYMHWFASCQEEEENETEEEEPSIDLPVSSSMTIQ